MLEEVCDIGATVHNNSVFVCRLLAMLNDTIFRMLSELGLYGAPEFELATQKRTEIEQWLCNHPLDL